MDTTTTPQISVVVLCYRSGNFARIFYQRVVDTLTQHHLDYEIVLVGNYRPGTDDTTPVVVKEIADSHERTISVVKEKLDITHAMGWDMRCGLEASTGNVIVVIDGDGQMPPEDIPRLFDTLTKEHLDMCKAKRITRDDGIYRACISFVFNGLMSVLFPGIMTNDINGKPKMFTRKVLERLRLKSNDWFIDAEIMIKARRYNFRIGEIETEFYKNPKRPSFISFTANLEFLKNIFVWRIKEFRDD